MSSVTDLCFMCSNDNKCNEVDNKIVTQVEYLMPEITIIKMGISLRICSSCEAELRSFNNFKKACVDNSLRLEAKIKKVLCSQDDNPGIQLEIDVIDTDEDDLNSEPDFPIYEETVDQEYDTPDTEQQTENDGNIIVIVEDIPIEDKLPEENRDFHILKNIPNNDRTIDNVNCDANQIEKFNKNTISKFDSKFRSINNGFECERCSKWFKFKSNFERHMTTHSEIRDFRCQICKKLFKESSHLNSHVQIHYGIKKYNCTICGQLFVQNSHVKDHMKIHNGLKDFKCSVCNRLFSRNSNLKRHLETHSSGTDVQCKICNKLFALKTSLRGHMKTHTR